MRTGPSELREPVKDGSAGPGALFSGTNAQPDSEKVARAREHLLADLNREPSHLLGNGPILTFGLSDVNKNPQPNRSAIIRNSETSLAARYGRATFGRIEGGVLLAIPDQARTSLWHRNRAAL